MWKLHKESDIEKEHEENLRSVAISFSVYLFRTVRDEETFGELIPDFTTEQG